MKTSDEMYDGQFGKNFMDKIKEIKMHQNLDIHIIDKNPKIRGFVGRQGYGLNVLVRDENDEVRLIIADAGYCLDVLCQDKDWGVRQHVAIRGYELDTFLNNKEEDFRVKLASNIFLTQHSITIDEYISNKDFWNKKAVEI